MQVTLKKAVRLIKNMPMGLPGQVVEIDESQVERFIHLGIIDDPRTAEAEEAPQEPAPDEGPEDPGEEPEDVSEDPAPKPEVTDKPKPTESVEKHRTYLASRGIETKGLNRAQMIKIISGLDK